MRTTFMTKKTDVVKNDEPFLRPPTFLPMSSLMPRILTWIQMPPLEDPDTDPAEYDPLEYDPGLEEYDSEATVLPSGYSSEDPDKTRLPSSQEE